MVEIRLQPVFAHDGVTIDRVRIGIYEVLCPECGDDNGPFEHQSLELQKLRGPYLHIDDATRAATTHRREHEPSAAT